MQFVKEKDNYIYVECEECGRIMKLRKDLIRFDNSNSWCVINEGIECFCENISNRIINTPINKVSNDSGGYLTSDRLNPIGNNRNIPKCPTCGSERVEKISVGSKVVGGAMFGLFSSNVRKSYRCKNCGYKW